MSSNRSIIRTEALVLRSLDYGETSQIVTLFTREKGKVSVMAKGARRIKSSYGSTLQPMAYTQVVFYYKATRTLQTLTESSHAEAFLGIRRRLDKITVGLRVMELIAALMEEEDPYPETFALALRILRRLNASQTRIHNLWPYTQLRLATQLGMGPSIERDNVEAVAGESGLLSLANGGVYPLDAEPRAAETASRQALRAYAIFARADLDAVMRLELAPSVRLEVERLVDAYLRYHFEEAVPDRSRTVIAQLQQRPS